MPTSAPPWYREPWTWLLIGLPATAVVASLTSAAIAIQGADPIVADDYYERGLDINQTLARIQKGASDGVHASVEYDGLRAGESIWVRVRAAHGVPDPSIRIRLLAPLPGAPAREAVLARVPSSPDGDAEYTGQWPAAIDPGVRPAAAGWRIELRGRDWQVEGDVQGRSDIGAR
jgi:hypothetical protein